MLRLELTSSLKLSARRRRTSGLSRMWRAATWTPGASRNPKSAPRQAPMQSTPASKAQSIASHRAVDQGARCAMPRAGGGRFVV